MRIVVVGAGEVGKHLAKMLSKENHELVIIDSDENRLKNLVETNDLLTLRGNVTSKKLLMEAGAGKADLFIAVTPWDDTNIVSAIMAKRLGAKLTVVRISNSEPMSRESRDIFISLGIDSFVYPEKIAAQEVSHILHKSGVSTLVEFCDGRLLLLAVKIDKKRAAEENETYRAVAIQRNGKTIIPSGKVLFEPDDTVYMVTNQSGIKGILRHLGQKPEQIKQVMILGGTHIGRLIAKELDKEYHIKVIEADRYKAYRLSNTLNNALVIQGDGTKADLLFEEGLRSTDVFVAVTDDSETNILTCLLAKSEGVRNTIAEIENLDYINLAERLGIDTIINKKLIAAGHIYRYTLTSCVSMIKYLTAIDAEVLEFVAQPQSKVIGKPINKIDLPIEAIVGGLVRGKLGYIATDDICIEPGDHLVIFSKPSVTKEVSKLFE